MEELAHHPRPAPGGKNMNCLNKIVVWNFVQPAEMETSLMKYVSSCVLVITSWCFLLNDYHLG